MRVKEVDHKEFVSSCRDDRINYLIRKVIGINCLVLHLLLWSNGAWGKPDQLKVEIWSKHVKVKAEDMSVMRVTGQTVCSQLHPGWRGRLTTESDKLTHTSASLLFTSLPFCSPLPSPSLSALIQLCICILNDSITWDPAVKIMDVFHYFSPLGHGDPSRALISPPPPFPIHLFLSTCLFSFSLTVACFFFW